MIARRPEVPPILADWSTWVMFAAELIWLVVLGIAGWRLGQGWWLGAVEAVIFVGILVAAWARWMAPRSRHRLDPNNRLIALILLGSVITVLGASAGLLIPAAAASVLIVVAHRRHNRLTGATDLRNGSNARRNVS